MNDGRKPLVLVLHGPSGVGKESVIEGLQNALGIHRATSTTDREPRGNEVDGVDYHFVTTTKFEQMIQAGAFAEYARVYEDWKGLERNEIERPLRRGQDVIIRTDVNGVRHWRRTLEGAVTVVIIAAGHKTPAEYHKTITRARIVKREPDISLAKLQTRLDEVDDELADADNNDYVVVNHQNGLDSAVAELRAIVEYERANRLRPTPRLL
ncbi:MAG: guanylate kinase [Dehalococcoidia bacterium]